jgi:butyrate kinase
MDEMLSIVSKRGGLRAYMGDVELGDIVRLYKSGDKKVMFLVDAMAYATAREIGSRAASLRGQIDGIVLTGPLATFDEFVAEIKSRVEWIAPIWTYTLGNELWILGITAFYAYQSFHRILLYGQDRK